MEEHGKVSFRHHKILAHHIRTQIRKRRFVLLLVASLLVLFIPGFLNDSTFSELFFFLCLSFLFVQSMIVATQSGTKNKFFRYITVALLIVVTWLEPAGISIHLLKELRLVAMILFFGFVVFSLAKYLAGATYVRANVLLAAVNIYLLMGIVGGYLAQLFFVIDANTFHFPAYINQPDFTDFVYYSFISMATVGFGDIVPGNSQGQTLSYLIAISGQLYVAIIIAIIVGKFANRPISDQKYKR